MKTSPILPPALAKTAASAALSQADIERIRLEQWNRLELIENAVASCRQKLIGSGDVLPVSNAELYRAAAILSEAAL